MILLKVNIKLKNSWNINGSIILFPFLLDNLQNAVVSYNITENVGYCDFKNVTHLVFYLYKDKILLLTCLVVLKHWNRLPTEAGEVSIFGEISSGHILCEVTFLGQNVELNDMPKDSVLLFSRRIRRQDNLYSYHKISWHKNWEFSFLCNRSALKCK